MTTSDPSANPPAPRPPAPFTPPSKFTDDDLRDFGRRIANNAREQLEGEDRAWLYLPSFQKAVSDWAAIILNSVLISERQYVLAQSLETASWRPIADYKWSDGRVLVSWDSGLGPVVPAYLNGTPARWWTPEGACLLNPPPTHFQPLPLPPSRPEDQKP